MSEKEARGGGGGLGVFAGVLVVAVMVAMVLLWLVGTAREALDTRWMEAQTEQQQAEAARVEAEARASEARAAMVAAEAQARVDVEKAQSERLLYEAAAQSVQKDSFLVGWTWLAVPATAVGLLLVVGVVWVWWGTRPAAGNVKRETENVKRETSWERVAMAWRRAGLYAVTHLARAGVEPVVMEDAVGLMDAAVALELEVRGDER